MFFVLTLAIASVFLIHSSAALFVYLRPPRMIIRVNVTSGETTTIERFLTVKNENNFSIDVQFQPGGDIANITHLEQNITLEPNETRDVNFTVDIAEPGTYNGKITVTYSSGTMPGVALDAEIIIFAEEIESTKPNPLTGNIIFGLSWAHIGLIFLVIIILFIAYVRIRRG